MFQKDINENCSYLVNLFENKFYDDDPQFNALMIALRQFTVCLK